MCRNEKTIQTVALVKTHGRQNPIFLSDDKLSALFMQVWSVRGNKKKANFPLPQQFRCALEHLNLRALDVGVHNVDPGVLPALSFYKETIFPQLEALHE